MKRLFVIAICLLVSLSACSSIKKLTEGIGSDGTTINFTGGKKKSGKKNSGLRYKSGFYSSENAQSSVYEHLIINAISEIYKKHNLKKGVDFNISTTISTEIPQGNERYYVESAFKELTIFLASGFSSNRGDVTVYNANLTYSLKIYDRSTGSLIVDELLTDYTAESPQRNKQLGNSSSVEDMYGKLTGDNKPYETKDKAVSVAFDKTKSYLKAAIQKIL